MLDVNMAIRSIQNLADWYNRGDMTEVEVVNRFLDLVFGVPSRATDDCLAVFPQAGRPFLLEYLQVCKERDSYESGSVHIRGWLDLGLDIAQQEQWHQQMHPHRRTVGERLLTLLQGENAS